MEQPLEKNERLLKRNAFEAKVLKDTREALLRTESAGARNKALVDSILDRLDSIEKRLGLVGWERGNG